MRAIRFVLILLSPLLFVACTSCLKRQECEKVNWYQHGHDLAMHGVRPGMDSYVQECRKVEADVKEADLDRGFKEGMNQYCLPDTVFQTGKSGEAFNTDFCDPGKLSMLMQLYRKGINEYCLPENGYQTGSSGKVYSKVCNAEQEKSFLPQYRKGRKKYLDLMVTENEKRLAEVDREHMSVERNLSLKSTQLAMLPGARNTIRREYDTGTKSWKETPAIEDPYQSDRSRLNREIDNENSRLSQLASTKRKLNEELSQFRRELVQLSD